MNKKALLPLLLFAAFALKLSAQFELVRESERMMSFGSRPGFFMEFVNTDAGVVEEVWKKFAKDNFKAKLKKSKGEWTANKLRAAFMGDDVFTLYSTIEKNGDKTSLNVWVDAGSYFLNRRDNKNSTEEMVRMLRQCYFDVRRAAIGKDLKMQENQLKALENKQKKLSKDNDELRRSIESWESRIQKARQDIVNNEQSQETNLVEQENQRSLVEETRRRLENVESEGGN
ncbi:MAG: hypothetical protein Q7T20_05870 [Saprospiraceae bacterium]|nr:hypothetical protein [Saprospiraceae bacterium]